MRRLATLVILLQISGQLLKTCGVHKNPGKYFKLTPDSNPLLAYIFYVFYLRMQKCSEFYMCVSNKVIR